MCAQNVVHVSSILGQKVGQGPHTIHMSDVSNGLQIPNCFSNIKSEIVAPEESISGLQGGGRGPLRIPGHQNHIFQELQSSKSMFQCGFLQQSSYIRVSAKSPVERNLIWKREGYFNEENCSKRTLGQETPIIT